jgi:hypothetical protein
VHKRAALRVRAGCRCLPERAAEVHEAEPSGASDGGTQERENAAHSSGYVYAYVSDSVHVQSNWYAVMSWLEIFV